MDFDKANFRRLRERRGLTQQELAVLLGVSKSAVSYWENPARREKPRPHRFETLQRVLHCTAAELAGTPTLSAAELRSRISDILNRKGFTAEKALREVRRVLGE